MALRCIACGDSKFQFSRLKLGDLAMLFTCHYPVRCRRCLERYYVSFAAAWKMRRSHARRRAGRERQHAADRKASA